MKYLKSIIHGGVDIFARIYPIIRPRYHNVLAWLVVAGGLSIVTAPIWEPFLRAILKTYFKIEVPSQSSPWFGFLLVVSGLIYHFFANYLEPLNRSLDSEHGTVEHDSILYKEFNSKLNDDIFRYFIDDLHNDHSFVKSSSSKIYDAIRFLSLPNTMFTEKTLKEDGDKFRIALINLTDFIKYNFFVWPENQQDRYCMYPDLNIDRNGNGAPEQFKRYASFEDELYKFIESAESAYFDFTKTAHMILGAKALTQPL